MPGYYAPYHAKGRVLCGYNQRAWWPPRQIRFIRSLPNAFGPSSPTIAKCRATACAGSWKTPPDFAVVGEAGDAAAALRLVLDHHPDLVLLDTSMPGMSPFTAGRLIEQDGGGTRIVYLTTQEDEQRVRWTLRSGAPADTC